LAQDKLTSGRQANVKIIKRNNRISFPFYRGGRFAGNIVGYAPYLFYGIGYPRGDFKQIAGLKRVDIGGHAVGADNGA
jgi:hypothetical protein